MTEKQPIVLILGGGFGGLYTALRLSQLPWDNSPKPKITVVDRNDRFVFYPLLYELLTGELQTWEIAPPFVELLQNTGIMFHQGVVSNINLQEKRVKFQDNLEIICDRLVLALGGETPTKSTPGVASHAYTFRTIHDVCQLEKQLQLLTESNTGKIRVVIVGGGYSGVELACKLADRLGDRGRLRLVEISDFILCNSPDYNRKAATRALDARRVFIDLNTKVKAIAQGSITLEYKGTTDTIPVDLVIWTIGNEVSPVIQSLDCHKNQQGQKIVVFPTLRLVEHPHIFALGDIAEFINTKGKEFPATAQVAFQQSDYVAWNIWATLTNRPLLPFQYQNLGEMMTLGVNNATLTGLGLNLQGPLASFFRSLVYLYRMPTLEHKLRVGVNWLTRPMIDILQR